MPVINSIVDFAKMGFGFRKKLDTAPPGSSLDGGALSSAVAKEVRVTMRALPFSLRATRFNYFASSKFLLFRFHCLSSRCSPQAASPSNDVTKAAKKRAEAEAKKKAKEEAKKKAKEKGVPSEVADQVNYAFHFFATSASSQKAPVRLETNCTRL